MGGYGCSARPGECLCSVSFWFHGWQSSSAYRNRTVFRLSESRAKGLEHSALKLLRHELLIEIPERAFVKAEDRLTKLLVEEGELHSVELRLKSQKKRGKKIATVVYEYLADCGGKWGELSYNFKDDTAEILLLAEWDTIISNKFAMRAIEYLRAHKSEPLPKQILLTFVSSEQ